MHGTGRIRLRLHKDLREFVALLSSGGVDFLVVGGFAVAYHGYPRFTGDIDLWVRADEATGTKVVAAMEQFGFADLGFTATDFAVTGQIIQLGRPPNRIDLLTSISGVTFEEAWATKEAAELDGLPVFFIGKRALIVNKKATGRAKDLADVEELDDPGR